MRDRQTDREREGERERKRERGGRESKRETDTQREMFSMLALITASAQYPAMVKIRHRNQLLLSHLLGSVCV